VLADLSHLQHDEGTPIDGVFGQPIFEDRVILIDRDRKYFRLSAKTPDVFATGNVAGTF
jgi:hypothetical protein